MAKYARFADLTNRPIFFTHLFNLVYISKNRDICISHLYYILSYLSFYSELAWRIGFLTPPPPETMIHGRTLFA